MSYVEGADFLSLRTANCAGCGKPLRLEKEGDVIVTGGHFCTFTRLRVGASFCGYECSDSADGYQLRDGVPDCDALIGCRGPWVREKHGAVVEARDE